MPRLVLPLGSKAPWVLGVLALALLVYGVASENDGLVFVGGVAAAALFVAFPLAAWLLGKDADPDQ